MDGKVAKYLNRLAQKAVNMPYGAEILNDFPRFVPDDWLEILTTLENLINDGYRDMGLDPNKYRHILRAGKNGKMVFFIDKKERTDHMIMLIGQINTAVTDDHVLEIEANTPPDKAFEWDLKTLVEGVSPTTPKDFWDRLDLLIVRGSLDGLARRIVKMKLGEVALVKLQEFPRVFFPNLAEKMQKLVDDTFEEEIEGKVIGSFVIVECMNGMVGIYKQTRTRMGKFAHHITTANTLHGNKLAMYLANLGKSDPRLSMIIFAMVTGLVPDGTYLIHDEMHEFLSELAERIVSMRYKELFFVELSNFGTMNVSQLMNIMTDYVAKAIKKVKNGESTNLFVMTITHIGTLGVYKDLPERLQLLQTLVNVANSKNIRMMDQALKNLKPDEELLRTLFVLMTGQSPESFVPDWWRLN